MISQTNANATNALFKFYAHAKDKEEAEKLIEYIDVLVHAKTKETMEDYVTKDFLRAELSQIRTEMSQQISQLSENMTKQINAMMMKTIWSILVPIMLTLLALFLKN
jgi:hypothetical protein